ncbi:hypothetical protein DOY81_014096 [Sarcophaga bullata]|nr:hypothetical protein DOY81_014096 [Sarcophaga bullata]
MIVEFFENREIFITGGSGVVGKALIEKLLRSCNVKKIYVLLRAKKNVPIEERLEKIKQEMIFRQLRLKKPRELDEKLMVIPGDATLPRLGITPEYEKQLQNVSLVFHCAATVRFDETLRDAIKLNVGGTFEALKFAETLKNLKVFMHVSTFFSNPYLERVEEKIYESPMDWKFLLNLVERQDISDEQLNVLTKKLVVGFANTYCFTKNVAESMVNDYRHKLPVAIYRPSIVLFSLEEPEPGFAPTLMGAMGLFAVTGAGILKTIYMGLNTCLDLTPQDIKVPLLLCHASTTQISLSSIYSNGSRLWFWNDGAFEKNLLLPYLHCTENRFVYLFLFFFKQLLVALLADFIMILSGRQMF